MNTATAAFTAIPKTWFRNLAAILAVISVAAAVMVPYHWKMVPIAAAIWFGVVAATACQDAKRERLFSGWGRTPTRSYQGDAGYDLHATADFEVGSGQVTEHPTGIRLELPAGTFAMIQERSSMARRGLFTVGNVIDGGYKGEIHVLVANMGRGTERFLEGDRIAQIIILPTHRDDRDKRLPARGENGFGSSGA